MWFQRAESLSWRGRPQQAADRKAEAELQGQRAQTQMALNSQSLPPGTNLPNKAKPPKPPQTAPPMRDTTFKPPRLRESQSNHHKNYHLGMGRQADALGTVNSARKKKKKPICSAMPATGETLSWLTFAWDRPQGERKREA